MTKYRVSNLYDPSTKIYRPLIRSYKDDAPLTFDLPQEFVDRINSAISEYDRAIETLEKLKPYGDSRSLQREQLQAEVDAIVREYMGE